jgi:hypothetical protein
VAEFMRSMRLVVRLLWAVYAVWMVGTVSEDWWGRTAAPTVLSAQWGAQCVPWRLGGLVGTRRSTYSALSTVGCAARPLEVEVKDDRDQEAGRKVNAKAPPLPVRPEVPLPVREIVWISGVLHHVCDQNSVW